MKGQKKSKSILILSFIICILSSGYTTSQNNYKEIDSVNSITHSFIISNPQKAVSIFHENVKKARDLNYKYGLASALSKLALANYIKGNYDESTAQWIEAIRIFEGLKKFKDLSFAYSEFGYQLKRLDMKRANYYMQMGIQISEKNNFNDLHPGQYNNYGVLKELEENYDSAYYFYNKALAIKRVHNDSLGIPYSLNNLAGIFALKSDFGRAFEFLTLSDRFRAKEKNSFGQAENLSLRADFHNRLGNIDSAIFYYSKGLQVSKTVKSNYLIQAFSEQLMKLYSRKGDYRNAYEYHIQYDLYKDSLMNKETQEKIAELQVAFESERKDKMLAEHSLAIKQKSFQQLIMLGIIVLLSIIFGVIFFFQRLKRIKTRRELELKNKLSKAEMENKLRSEKLRISRDLHDNIGSQLTFIISSLDNLGYSLKNNEISGRISSIGKFSRDVLLELRNTVWAIKMEEGSTTDLLNRIYEMTQKSGSKYPKISINNQLQHIYMLSSVQILNLYRIIQEAVQNAVKHSCASEVLISLSECSEGLLLVIEDNGKGFNSEQIFSGNGLANMKSRCEEIDGIFSINTESGTRISCRILKNSAYAVLSAGGALSNFKEENSDSTI